MEMVCVFVVGLLCGFGVLIGLLALIGRRPDDGDDDGEPILIDQMLRIDQRLHIIDPCLARPLTEEEVFTCAANKHRIWMAEERLARRHAEAVTAYIPETGPTGATGSTGADGQTGPCGPEAASGSPFRWRSLTEQENNGQAAHVNTCTQ